jgi:hypothetical protein
LVDKAFFLFSEFRPFCALAKVGIPFIYLFFVFFYFDMFQIVSIYFIERAFTEFTFDLFDFFEMLGKLYVVRNVVDSVRGKSHFAQAKFFNCGASQAWWTRLEVGNWLQELWQNLQLGLNGV